MSVPKDSLDGSEKTSDTSGNFHLLTRDQVRAIEHQRRIEQGETEPTFALIPSQGAHFSLFPLAKVKGDRWRHKNAFGTVSITAGDVVRNGEIQTAGVPFGGLPRLLMVHIMTEIHRIDKAGGDPSRLDLSESLTQMVSDLGLKRGSRNNAVLAALEDTLSAHVMYGESTETVRNGLRGTWTKNIWAPNVASALSLWVPAQDPLEGFEPYIELTPEYVSTVLQSPMMPVRKDLLAQIVGKPMSFDILVWLQNVVFAVNMRGSEKFLPWTQLFTEFTHDYERLKDFVARWKRALTEALRYYPEARVELVRGTRGKPGGIVVKSSPLLVPQKRNQLPPKPNATSS